MFKPQDKVKLLTNVRVDENGQAIKAGQVGFVHYVRGGDKFRDPNVFVDINGERIMVMEGDLELVQ